MGMQEVPPRVYQLVWYRNLWPFLLRGLEDLGRLLRWDREAAIDYMGLGRRSHDY